MCLEIDACTCVEVMRKVYKALLARNIPESWAVDSTRKIYELYHPDASKFEAKHMAHIVLAENVELETVFQSKSNLRIH